MKNYKLPLPFLFFFTLISFSINSAETDQFLALNKKIEDSTKAINEMINENLKIAIEKANRKDLSCYKLTKTFAKEVGSGDESLRDVPIRKILQLIKFLVMIQTVSSITKTPFFMDLKDGI